MNIITMSGPADNLREAREVLTGQGYFVLSRPPVKFDLEVGEALLAVESDDPEAPVNVVANLGWRHRNSAQWTSTTGPADGVATD